MLDGIFKGKRGGFYIAEIGLNHNGSADVARRMIQAAARAGADAVKFQTFMPELMNSPYTTDLLGPGREGKGDRAIIDFFKKLVLPPEAYGELKALAESCGMTFFSSVFDMPSLELMKSLDVGLYKLASSEVTNLALVEAVARTGRPLIMSTGMSSGDEIEMAVNAFRSVSGAELVLLHCVSLYPLLPDDVNILRIRSLSDRFGCHTGFSDHTADILAPALAAAFGARVFEKHFTIDRFYECPDKEVSLPPDDFSVMIVTIERAIRMAGTGELSCSGPEQVTARAARRSLFAARTITAGSAITADDLVALRPGTGMPPYRAADIIGRTAAVDIPGGMLIREEQLA